MERVQFANSLRGVAAVAVLISHYARGFWFLQPDVATLTGLPVLNIGVPPYVTWLNSWSLLMWGPFGVALFFTISGFVIPFSLATYRPIPFLLARVIRIYPTYFVCFAITLAFLFVGTWCEGVPFPHSFQSVIIHFFPGLHNAMWSPIIDGIIWSLEIEVKFYVISACIAGWMARGSALVFLIPAALFAIVVVLGWWIPILVQGNDLLAPRLNFIALDAPFIIFMFCGVALNFLYRELITGGEAALWVAVMFALYVMCWTYGSFPHTLYPWSYAIALIVFLVAMNYPAAVEHIPFRDFVAKISYPLYAVHGVTGFILLDFMMRQGFKSYIAIGITTGVAILMASVVHRYVEQPTHRLGQRLAKSYSPPACKQDRNA